MGGTDMKKIAAFRRGVGRLLFRQRPWPGRSRMRPDNGRGDRGGGPRPAAKPAAPRRPAAAPARGDQRPPPANRPRLAAHRRGPTARPPGRRRAVQRPAIAARSRPVHSNRQAATAELNRPGRQSAAINRRPRGRHPATHRRSRRPATATYSSYHRNFNAPRRFRAADLSPPARAGMSHRWIYGEILPAPLLGRDYWINDYFDYGLMPPPPARSGCAMAATRS